MSKAVAAVAITAAAAGVPTAPVANGPPRKYAVTNLAYSTVRALSELLWSNDYKPIVSAVLERSASLAASLRGHLLSAPGRYANRGHVDQAWHKEKMDLRVALHIEELDQQASQKNKSVLCMARSISAHSQKESRSHQDSTSYQGLR